MPELLLFSGGLDSTCLAAWRRPDALLFVDYGQRAADGERAAAARIAALLGLPLDEFATDLRPLGSGTLAGSPANPLAAHPEWWPFRNQLLVTMAGAWALGHGLDRVLTGTVATDRRHADGTAVFYDALDRVTALQEGGLRVEAPAVGMRAEDLVPLSGATDEVLSWTHSCHTGPVACGTCGGCVKRAAVLLHCGRLQG